MSTPDFTRARELFDRAEALEPQARADFLTRECGDDEALRAEVESLLRSREKVGGFLDAPIAGWTGRSIGRYVVESVIAQGGMGVVLRARQEFPRRSVALKIVRAALTQPNTLQRFELEAEALGRLDHPGIASIFEAGTFEQEGESRPFLAMELIEGAPLTTYVTRERLGVRAIIELVASICDAVHHAHLRGVIHRDLKPANILVRADGQPKVLDFGVARFLDLDVRITSIGDSTSGIIGTLPYMSPEQIRGDRQATEVRSDLYSLGVVLFEVLTGRLPHRIDGADLVELLRILSTTAPERLNKGPLRFPADLETIVEKCLRHEPARRYESAAELAADLRRFLREEPILARPPSTSYQLRKFARRNRGAVVAVGATLGALLLGLVVSIAGWREASEERTRARLAADEANAVTGFLTDLLASADPYFDGREVRVADVLDRAAARAEDEFHDRPELGLRVHDVLASTYKGLGLSASTGHQRRLAVAHAERIAATAGNAVLVEPLVDLGSHLLDIGDVAGADSLAARLVEARAALPPSSLSHFRSDIFLAHVLEARGDFDSAAELLSRSLETANQLREPQDPEFPSVRASLELALGNLLWQIGETQRARDLMVSGVASHAQRLGPENPSTTFAMNNLAIVYQQLGQFDDARRTFEELLEIKQRTLGVDHPSTGLGHHNLAHFLRVVGQPEDALPHHLTALRIQTAIVPVNPVRTAVYRVGYGRSLLALGRRDEALAELEPSHRVLLDELGPDHPNVKVLGEEIAAARQQQ